MPTVRIPTPLRQFTGGQKVVPASGRTVAETLESLMRKYPGIRAALYDERGKIQSFVHIYVGDTPASAVNNMPIEETTEISIVPAIAGG